MWPCQVLASTDWPLVSRLECRSRQAYAAYVEDGFEFLTASGNRRRAKRKAGF